MTDTVPRPLRMLLDSAEVAQWRRFLPLGLIYGVTTNPLLLERAQLACNLEILTGLATTAEELGAQEIHLQTWGDTAQEMLSRGLELAQCGTSSLRVLVKVPATFAGLQAARDLLATGCSVTLTAVFNRGQVMAAAAMGAAYAAPYLGRMLDDQRPGMSEIQAMQAILRSTGAETRLLVASLRTAEQIGTLAAEGIDTFTMVPKVLEELLTDELTLRAAADFNRAARA